MVGQTFGNFIDLIYVLKRKNQWTGQVTLLKVYVNITLYIDLYNFVEKLKRVARHVSSLREQMLNQFKWIIHLSGDIQTSSKVWCLDEAI